MKKAAILAAAVLAVSALTASPASAKLFSGSDANVHCEPENAAGDARVRPGYEHLDMGTVSRAQQRSMERQMRQALKGVKVESRGTIRVPTRVHIIRRNDGTGNVTDTQVTRQMRVINNAFKGMTSDAAAPTPFRFNVVSIDRTNNTDWYNWTFDDDDVPAKRALHQGRANTLNIYIAGLQEGLLGYAFFPVPDPLFRDGLVILNESMPGGSAAPYNKGDTATHEIGHWLNLYHTFQNGCARPGDEVADTPYQFDGNNIFECDPALNTCSQPGRDPIHNFMSYGDDLCLDMFTAGQSNRMVAAWNAFRAP